MTSERRFWWVTLLAFLAGFVVGSCRPEITGVPFCGPDTLQTHCPPPKGQ